MTTEFSPLRPEVEGYYHRILPFLDEELQGREDLAFWGWVAREWAGAEVLELGAGTGRVTKVLARSARRLVTVDLCLELVARARRRLLPSPRVLPMVADLRQVPLRRPFDLIVAADDPLCHLLRGDDRDRALVEVAEHLRASGVLILDALWLSPRARRKAATPEGLMVERECGSGTPPLEIRERWRCDPATACCVARMEYRRGTQTLVRARFRARYWSVSELQERCVGAGLEILELWGDYRRRPWSRGGSSRLVVLARRSGRSPGSVGASRAVQALAR